MREVGQVLGVVRVKKSADCGVGQERWKRDVGKRESEEADDES